MNKYVATFHSHFGALSYYKALSARGITAKLSPVPRKVSSSCGTCVYYEHDSVVDIEDCELDDVYIEVNNEREYILKK
ncbi:MAG: DUF3343 domain-containing protein [Synergistaceae bacterium]|nr:DUF3343 domain-containing protein [Synergistaceae bacterium]